MNPPPSQHTDALTQEIRSMLRLQDASSLAGSLGQVFAGAGVCLIMGIVVATGITAILYALFGTTWIGFGGWFVVYVIVLVPFLIWHERQSREDYLLNSAWPDSKPSSHGEYKLNQAIVDIAFYSSLLVWGPRRLIDGTRALRGRRPMAEEAVFDRAAGLVVDLAKVQGGIEIKQLVHAPEDMRIFGAAVDLLDKHGWIGKSSDSRSMWLNSTFRQKVRYVVKAKTHVTQ